MVLGFSVSFAARDDVLVAGNLLWYPVKGDNQTRIAPNVMIALGRPNGDRYSYHQWQEANLPPQFVLDVRPPNGHADEMTDRFAFYRAHGVKEYVRYDPYGDGQLDVWVRRGK